MLGNRTVFVPRSLCGAALLTALDGSFAIFCVVCRLHTKAPLFERAPLRSSAQSAYASYTQAQWFSILTLRRGTLIHHSRPRKGQSPKSAVIRGLLIKSRVNAVPRDVKRNLVDILFLCVLTFDMRMRTNLFAICITKPKTNLLNADKLTTTVARNRASRAT